MSANRILIVGAGVAGLALAQGLFKSGIEFAVFEKDDFLDSRLQGYRLKLVGDIQNKLKALMADDAWADFEATAAETTLGETNVNATDGAVVACRREKLPEGMTLPYTIDRGMLRRALTKGIEYFIFYGKQFTHYEYKKGIDQIRAFFADGTAEDGTLLVGSDGIRSAVRKQMLPDYQLFDTRSCCIYGKSIVTPELLEQFPHEYRRWITVVQDSTPKLQRIISGDAPVGLVTEPVYFKQHDSHCDIPADYIHWGILFLTENNNISSASAKDGSLDDSLRKRPVELSLELTQEWHPAVRSLIKLQDPTLTVGMRIYSAHPDMPSWTSSPRVTALGDAVHAMSPTGGVGAIAALHDSAALVDILREGGVSLSSINKFEQQMRSFSSICLQRSFRAGDHLIKAPFFDDCTPAELK